MEAAGASPKAAARGGYRSHRRAARAAAKMAELQDNERRSKAREEYDDASEFQRQRKALLDELEPHTIIYIGNSLYKYYMEFSIEIFI
jgi:hypothetical protein